MKIDTIKIGIVIDHIEAGKGKKVYDFLELEQLDCTVALIKNVPPTAHFLLIKSGVTAKAMTFASTQAVKI